MMALPNLNSIVIKLVKLSLFQLRAVSEGPVWGTDIYTDDSNLAVAAVHAGAINMMVKRKLHIKILPGEH